MVTVTERLYRNAAGDLVGQGSPDAAILAYPAGAEISDEEARRSGVAAYLDAQKAPAEPEPEPEKQQPAAPNKMAARPADKTARPSAEKPGPKRGEE